MLFNCRFCLYGLKDSKKMIILRWCIFRHDTVGCTSVKSVVKFITNNLKMRDKVIRKTMKIIPRHLRNDYNDLRCDYVCWIGKLRKYQRQLLRKQCVDVIARKFVKYLQENYEQIQIDIDRHLQEKYDQINNVDICVAG